MRLRRSKMADTPAAGSLRWKPADLRCGCRIFVKAEPYALKGERLSPSAECGEVPTPDNLEAMCTPLYTLRQLVLRTCANFECRRLKLVQAEESHANVLSQTMR